MIIYGELLFLENLIIGGVLLYITGEIHGKNADTVKVRLRLLAASILCGIFSLVIFLDIKAPLQMLMEAVFAVVVCMTAFGGEYFKDSVGKDGGKLPLRQLHYIPWRYAITFILVTYFMGGMIMGLLLVTHQTGIYTAAGIYTGDMKAGLLAILVALTAMTVKQIIKTVKVKKFCHEYTFSTVIVIGENRFQAKAFLDTGNGLREPITGRPAAVASEQLWHRIQGCRFTEHRLALIPYETVGAKGLMQAVRVDYVEINGNRIARCFIAGTDGKFSAGDGKDSRENYDLLISGEMIKKGILP